MSDTTTRLKIMREVSVQADNDDFYNKARELGEIAAQNMGTDHRSQITNLENIANNAMKVTDVLNYLKKQIGKSTDKKSYWVQQHLGDQLLNFIETTLKNKTEIISEKENLKLTDPAEKQRIHLLLIREFVRQLAAHYEWKANQ